MFHVLVLSLWETLNGAPRIDGKPGYLNNHHFQKYVFNCKLAFHVELNIFMNGYFVITFATEKL